MTDLVTIHSTDPVLLAVLLNSVAEEVGTESIELRYVDGGMVVASNGDGQIEGGPATRESRVAQGPPPPIAPDRPAEIAGAWPCDDCDFIGKNKQSISMHRTRRHGKTKPKSKPDARLQCPECGQKFNRQNGLSRHLSQSHGGKKKDDGPKATPLGDKCSCGKRFVSQRGLVIHSRATGHVIIRAES